MMYAGLDLSRKRADVCLLDEDGERVAVTAAPPDADGQGSACGRTSLVVTPAARRNRSRRVSALLQWGTRRTCT